MKTARKIKLTIQYNGTAYHGWAVQPGLPTVQGTLEEAFEKLCGRKVEVVGSSRTDAGVHALAQTAHVVLEDCPIPTANLQKALNRLLPPDVAVAGVEEVPDSFDAVRSTRGKLYRYTLCTLPIRPVLEMHRCWHYPYPLNVEAMQQAARYLLGTRDFKSFASAGDCRQSSVRTITLCRVEHTPPWITIEIAADGFLYNMVRNIVGTLVEIGRGRWQPDRLNAILEAKNRAAAGPIAPPGGLCLMQIFY